MIVLIDNTGKQRVKMFLPKLVGYLDKNKVSFVVVKGDVEGLEKLKKLKSIDGVIMSGSPIMPTEDNSIVDYVCNLYCLKHLTDIPLLGICFGCQIINLFFGGTLHDQGHLVCQKEPVNMLSKELELERIKKAKFCSKYLLNCVPSKLFDIVGTVSAEGGGVFPCVIQHKKRPVTGIMFHPEGLVSTHVLLDQFLQTCNKNKGK